MNEKSFCPFCGHALTTKFIEDRNRLFCRRCVRPIYENPIPATAALVVNEAGELLLVKRKAEPKAGLWCLPGGFVELHETPEACCIRELKEETNLSGEIERLVGVHLSENPIYKSVVVVGYAMGNVKGELLAGDDSEEAAFFKLTGLPTIAFQSHLALIEEMFGPGRNGSGLPVSQVGREDWGAYVISSQDHCELIGEACRAGARIVQYRDKFSGKGQLLKTARKIREITTEYNTLFIVNDHVDVALISGADGVHLGQEDLPLKEARKIVPPGFIIGISTHTLTQAEVAMASGADYIAIGPVFATPTKEDYKPIGIDTVEEVLGLAAIPVVAIGGLDLNNFDALRQVGVRNIAMVRAFREETERVVKAINQRLLATVDESDSVTR